MRFTKLGSREREKIHQATIFIGGTERDDTLTNVLSIKWTGGELWCPLLVTPIASYVITGDHFLIYGWLVTKYHYLCVVLSLYYEY